MSDVVELANTEEVKRKNTETVNFLRLFIDIPSYIRNNVLINE